ncbi:hypothetical protein E2562_005286 [Oryza meyeriana var. granulata]|uniref:DUF834 domain-containing protein n=1 Tax=Oryza meyeriana var. granulata TaxID=110450 RepID=A0A6G1EDY9_9ORYZ|nr:hypothetical protein E2562_005286 [Oryza meyeriana var. granulata]
MNARKIKEAAGSLEVGGRPAVASVAASSGLADCGGGLGAACGGQAQQRRLGDDETQRGVGGGGLSGRRRRQGVTVEETRSRGFDRARELGIRGWKRRLTDGGEGETMEVECGHK